MREPAFWYTVPTEEESEMSMVTSEAPRESRDDGTLRSFESGATRDTAENKFDYEGFLHPWVLEMYADYMHRNREQADGAIRNSDNWQKGIPRDVYMKSMMRHFMEVWGVHRTEIAGMDVNRGDRNEALCALLFNVMGMMYEIVAEEMGLRGGLPETTLHEITESTVLAEGSQQAPQDLR